MEVSNLKFQGHLCYSKDWSGFEEFKPINAIIGRNNSGKSHLLDLVRVACATPNEQGHFNLPGVRLQCVGVLDKDVLARVFRPGTSAGDLGGDHWGQHGAFYLGKRIKWVTDHTRKSIFEIELIDPPDGPPKVPQVQQARDVAIREAIQAFRTPLSGKRFQLILADRDISPEGPSDDPVLGANGGGATNIIRKFITSSNNKFPRDLIQVKLLKELNTIYGQDAVFTEIQIQLHDDSDSVYRGSWEIFLGEKGKSLVPLSKSGSGLKTIILVLLNLYVIPHILGVKASQIVYAFEELENNLHPALIRRLLIRLEDFAIENESHIFLTTHSNIALDIFCGNENSQIIHISNDGSTSRAATIGTLPSVHTLLSDLGARPSDLLQANGIIWVEGPSDRIYINKWIELFGEGRFEEGRHYQCAFYGGALLNRVTFRFDDPEDGTFFNLLRLNPNIALVCDGDRTSEKGIGSRLKKRVARIRDEVLKIEGSHLWITKAKEIEHYIHPSIHEQIFNVKSLPAIGIHELFFPSEGKKPTPCFLVDKLGRCTIDKIELAIQATKQMTVENTTDQHDLHEETCKLLACISKWNK
jgi:hypothetical protein